MQGEADDLRNDCDKLTEGIIRALEQRGYLGDHGCGFDSAQFHEFARRAESEMEVPQTAYSTTAARFLYATASNLRPRTIAVLGSYYGNGAIWLIAGAKGKLGAESHIHCCDSDPIACAGASGNFARLGLGGFSTVCCISAQEFLRDSESIIDLLLIDVSDPFHGKRQYRDLLELAIPRLQCGSVVLAHDRYISGYSADIKLYCRAVEESGLFQSVSLPIDEAGFEFSRKL